MKKKSLLLYGLICFCTLTIAQLKSPGGVPGVKVWMQTDVVADSLSLQKQYRWNDISGDSTKLRIYNRRGTSRGNEYLTGNESVQFYNFHPAIPLSGKGNLELALNTPLSQSTIFSVWAPNEEFNRDHFLYFVKGRAGEDILITETSVLQGDKGGKTFTYGSEVGKDMIFHEDAVDDSNALKELELFKERALQIHTYYRALPPDNSVWGEANSLIITGESYPVSNNDFTYANQLSQLDKSNVPFYGFTPEFIVYNRILQPFERRRVESYLAIKYGLTLDGSYYNSAGDLLWDMDNEGIYGNRITAYVRDDGSNLYQTQATTSYEEGPYFSHNYSSYQTEPDYKPTAYRLMVFGKQKASPLKDGEYLFVGDNGDPLSVDTINNNVAIMKRQWMVKTNIPVVTDVDKKLEWDVQGLTMHTHKFTSIITKRGSASDAYGSVVTKVALQERDGYFSWVTGMHPGPVTVKFGSNNPTPSPGSNDYGYYFDNNGDVYAIEKGIRSSQTVASIGSGQKIEMEKEGNLIFLRINGHRNLHHRIVISGQDMQSLFYGSVMIGRNNTDDIVMSDFQHGGFVDTGDWLELSYVSKRAEDFLKHSNTGKSFLLIDRSGKGDFENDVDTVYSTGVDVERSKIIFNNIFWKTPETGDSIFFTFGYKLSQLSSKLTYEQPTCNDDGVIQEDGIIRITMFNGLQGYRYSLQEPLKEMQTGVFIDDTLALDSIPSGTYILTVGEIGGTNFTYKAAGTGYALSKNYTLDTSNVWIDWSITDDTDATIAFMASNEQIANPYRTTPHYGMRMERGKLYSYVKGVKTPFETDSIACRIRLERKEEIINVTLYDKDDKAVITKDIAVITQADYSAYFYGAISIISGSQIYNVKANGLGDYPDWYLTVDMEAVDSDKNQVRHVITLKSPCEKGIVPPTPPAHPAGGSGDDQLMVYKSGENQANVSITLEKPSPGQLLLWNASGKLLNTITLLAKRKQEVTITFPAPGLYIIKVITNETELGTRKVLN